MSEMPDKRILVVEDEKEIAQLVVLHLEDLGCEVRAIHDGREALEILRAEDFDLLILDLMLPGVDGLEICRRLRQEDRDYLPILMLTARSAEIDRVLGLELGADDYLTKPFSIRELVARVKAILRRAEAFGVAKGSSEILEVGELRIEIDKRRVSLGKRAIELTAKEFDLLVQFVRNPGRVYNRAELLDRVWGYAYSGYEHTVNTHINRLRGKIEEDPSRPRYIETVWGVGYRFYEPGDSA